MDIEIAKKLISKYMEGHTHFVAKAKTAERYYNNDNDIHYREDKGKNSESAENPMRNADNKIALGFYRLHHLSLMSETTKRIILLSKHWAMPIRKMLSSCA